MGLLHVLVRYEFEDSLMNDPGNPNGFMWLVISYINVILSRVLIGISGYEKGDTKVIQDILECMIDVSEARVNLPFTQNALPQRFSACVSMESSCLVLMTNVNSDIVRIAAKCLEYVVDEAEVAQRQAELVMLPSVLADRTVYVSLMSVLADSEKFLVNQNKILQKNIRSGFRKITLPTPGNMSAWEELYRTWKTYYGSILKVGFLNQSMGDATVEADLNIDMADWINVSGALVSMGHLCLLAESQYASFVDDSSDSQSIAKQLMQSYSQARVYLELFLKEFCSLWASNNTMVRESVKDIIGQEASGGMLPIVFSHLSSTCQRLFSNESEPIVNDRNIILAELILTILKSIIDRSDEIFVIDPQRTYVRPQDLKLDDLLLSLAQFLQGVMTGGNNTSSIIRSKIKVCQLSELLFKKKGLTTLSKEPEIKNKLSLIIMEWNSDFLRASSASMSSLSQLQVELDIISISAMKEMFARMALRSFGDDSKQALFLRYFGFFLKVFETCKSLASVDMNANLNMNQELWSLVTKTRESIRHLTVIKQDAITALANLIVSNLNEGLAEIIARIPDTEPKLRSFFLQVLVKIIQLGSTEKMALVNSKRTAFDDLGQLFVDHPTILACLSQVATTHSTDVAQALYDFFSEKQKLDHLLLVTSSAEIRETDSVGSIFRRNSCASRLMTMFVQSELQGLVKNTISPIISQMADSNLDYEMDPSKTDPQKLPLHQKALETLTQSFLNSLLSPIDDFSPNLRWFCGQMKQTVSKKFPNSGLVGVGNVIFLRVICPMIAASDDNRLTSKARRGLILVSKIIQNLANNIQFGGKEYFMEPLNVFLSNNRDGFQNFLSQLCVGSFNVDLL